MTNQIEVEFINHAVHRPAGRWTKQVHKFLRFLRDNGFNQAPEPLGFDEQGREVVSFVEGQTCDYPLSKDVASLNALVSAAKLLRAYHDVSQKFLKHNPGANQDWMLPCQSPQEVICHNDFAPYNICFDGEQAVGIIDFDTAHPPAYLGYRLCSLSFCPFYKPRE